MTSTTASGTTSDCVDTRLPPESAAGTDPSPTTPHVACDLSGLHLPQQH